jgi:hypothetical protein
MIEILAIIYLCGKIGNLADRKGVKRGAWQFYTVLAWLGAEVFGILVGIMIFRENGFAPAVILGYALAIGSFFILRAVLLKKPDVVEPSFEFEQQSPQ